MKRIIFISDTHGYLPDNLPEGDILCICGDIFPLAYQDNIEKSSEWLETKFIPWTTDLPYNNIVLIAGNHDFYFESMEAPEPFLLFDNTKITYLQDSYVIINKIKFYGTPWCHKFGEWAFMNSDEWLEKRFSTIPDDVDFLLTHDAPYGYSDLCLQPTAFTNPYRHIGSKPLCNAIEEKQPDYVIHGHLHSSNHAVEILGKSKIYNVSLLNEYYEPQYSPLVIDYEK